MVSSEVAISGRLSEAGNLTRKGPGKITNLGGKDFYK